MKKATDLFTMRIFVQRLHLSTWQVVTRKILTMLLSKQLISIIILIIYSSHIWGNMKSLCYEATHILGIALRIDLFSKFYNNIETMVLLVYQINFIISASWNVSFQRRDTHEKVCERNAIRIQSRVERKIMFYWITY